MIIKVLYIPYKWPTFCDMTILNGLIQCLTFLYNYNQSLHIYIYVCVDWLSYTFCEAIKSANPTNLALLPVSTEKYCIFGLKFDFTYVKWLRLLLFHRTYPTPLSRPHPNVLIISKDSFIKRLLKLGNSEWCLVQTSNRPGRENMAGLTEWFLLSGLWPLVVPPTMDRLEPNFHWVITALWGALWPVRLVSIG